MKIITLQKNLKAAVYAVNHIAQKNTNLPILNNILLSAKNGVIQFISTNLEIGITSLLRGKIEAEGSFTVDAKLFSEYVSLLDNDKVTLELANNELTVECAENLTKIKGMSAEEFPFIPTVDRSQAYTLPVAEFKQAVSQTVFAAASDENRAELSGVLIVVKDKELIMAATDSYRLAEKRILLAQAATEERRCIIPARTLQEVVRLLGADTGEDETPKEVALYISENQCLFVIGNTEVVSRLIDGQYPDYAQIIPAKHAVRALVNRSELTRSVKAAAIFSKSGVYDIVFEFRGKDNKLSVSAASGQTGEHTSTLGAAITGEALSITLNSRYVLDVLAVMNNETAVFEVVDGDAPCLVRDGEKSDYLYLIMPIRK